MVTLSNEEVILYMNGVVEGEKKLSHPLYHSLLEIDYFLGPTYARNVALFMSDCRLFSYPLAAEEVAHLYTNGPNAVRRDEKELQCISLLRSIWSMADPSTLSFSPFTRPELLSVLIGLGFHHSSLRVHYQAILLLQSILSHVQPQQITCELVKEAFKDSPHFPSSLQEEPTKTEEKGKEEEDKILDNLQHQHQHQQPHHHQQPHQKGALLLVKIFFHIISCSFLDPSETVRAAPNATSENVMVVGVVKLLRSLLSSPSWGKLVEGVLEGALEGAGEVVEGWREEIEKGVGRRREKAKESWERQERGGEELEKEIWRECGEEWGRLAMVVLGEEEGRGVVVKGEKPDLAVIFRERKYVVLEKRKEGEKEEGEKKEEGKESQSSSEGNGSSPPSDPVLSRIFASSSSSSPSPLSSSPSPPPPPQLSPKMQEFQEKFISLCFFIRNKAILRYRQEFFSRQNEEFPPPPFAKLPSSTLTKIANYSAVLSVCEGEKGGEGEGEMKSKNKKVILLKIYLRLFNNTTTTTIIIITITIIIIIIITIITMITINRSFRRIIPRL